MFPKCQIIQFDCSPYDNLVDPSGESKQSSLYCMPENSGHPGHDLFDSDGLYFTRY